MIFNKTFATLLATATLVPTIALAGVSIGDAVGSTEAEIRTHFETQGYKIEEIEIEEDEIEVEATLDGLSMEFEIAAENGTVVAVEVDENEADDDDDDDDDEDGDEKKDG